MARVKAQPRFFTGIPKKTRCTGCGIRLYGILGGLFEKNIYCDECLERREAGVPPEGNELTQEMIDKIRDPIIDDVGF